MPAVWNRVQIGNRCKNNKDYTLKRKPNTQQITRRMKLRKLLISTPLAALAYCFSSCFVADKHVDEDKSSYYVYTKFKTKINFREIKTIGNGFGVPPIPTGATYTKMDADVKTFEVIDSYLAKDKNHVYWKTVIMEEADAATFHIDSTGILRDKNHIYDSEGTYPKEIEGIDAETYVFLQDYNWGKDKNHYYNHYKPLDVDTQTFEIFSHYIGYDKNSIYEFGKKPSPIITPAEGKLVRFAERALHDNKTVFLYYKSEIHKIPIKNISSVKYYGTADFSTLWGVDGTVYWNMKDMKEEDVDVESFRFIDFKYAKDRNQVYFDGKALWNADASTFTVKERFLACDKNKVFMGAKIVEYADPNTVRLEEGVPVDKNYRFYYDRHNTQKWIIDREKR